MADVPLDYAPPAIELLNQLKSESFTPSEYNTVILISLDGLPSPEDEAYWVEFMRVLQAFKTRFPSQIFRVSQIEYAIFVKMTEVNQINVNTSLKFDLLKLIQLHFPEFFGLVDQSRLVRTIDLRLRLKNAINYLEYRTKEVVEAKDGDASLRGLREQDIHRVRQVLNHIGPDAFAKLFITRQPIVVLKDGDQMSVAMYEYYVAMDNLRKHAFPDVELRGSGNLFNQLTVELDGILMSIYDDIVPKGTPASINLNVESVFTPTFEKFHQKRGEDGFASLVFEFRQPNILQHFDQYEVAANMIRERSGNIAVDAVFPETIGIVNLNRLGVSMAKVFWRQGAESIMPDFAEEIAEMQQRGRMIIMSRVDEDIAVEVGHSFGISMYQGFYVDRLMKYGEDNQQATG